MRGAQGKSAAGTAVTVGAAARRRLQAETAHAANAAARAAAHNIMTTQGRYCDGVRGAEVTATAAAAAAGRRLSAGAYTRPLPSST
jgi:hypothetical protein